MSERLRVISPDLRRFIPRELVDGPGWERLVRRVGELPGWPVSEQGVLRIRPLVISRPRPTSLSASFRDIRDCPGHFVNSGEDGSAKFRGCRAGQIPFRRLRKPGRRPNPP